MLSRILGVGLLLSLLANGVTTSLYYRAKAKTQTLVSETAVALNHQWSETTRRQAAAYEAELAERQRRLELSDQVTREALARADSASAEFRAFRESLQTEYTAHPEYANWAETKLPPGVADRLRELQ